MTNLKEFWKEQKPNNRYPDWTRKPKQAKRQATHQIGSIITYSKTAIIREGRQAYAAGIGKETNPYQWISNRRNGPMKAGYWAAGWVSAMEANRQ